MNEVIVSNISKLYQRILIMPYIPFKRYIVLLPHFTFSYKALKGCQLEC